MERLVILDYIIPTVHIYDIDSDVEVDEGYINDLGFNSSCCNWIVGNKMEIIYHKEVLK